MKTLVFFVSALLIPAFLFSQGLGQRQISSQSSNTGFQQPTSSYSVQQSNTYPVQQQVQQVQQQQVQPYHSGLESHSNIQNAYSNTKYDKNYSNIDASNRIFGTDQSNYLSNISFSLSKTDPGNISSDVFKKKQINKIIRTRPDLQFSKLNDIASTNYPIGVDANIKNVPEKQPKSIISPAKVYWLTPTTRLLNYNGSARNFYDIDGYGVYAGSFNNYQYCLAVSNWLRKKYKVDYFIFEDISHGVHFHLVFGRWVNHYSASIFKGKVSEDVPYAYIVRWTHDFKVLGFDQNLIYPKP